MRVVQYIDTLDPRLGGPVRSMINLTTSLASIGTDVVVAVRKSSSAAAVAECKGSAPVVEAGGRGLPGGALGHSAIRMLRDLLKVSDVLHVHNVWSLGTVQLSSLCHDYGVRLCVSPCGAFDDWSISQKRPKKTAFAHTAGRYMLRRTALLHASCELEAVAVRRYARRFDIPTAVLPKPIDKCLYKIASNDLKRRDRSTPSTVLFLGRLHPGKGLELALQTIAVLRRTGVNSRFVVAGTGVDTYQERLENLANVLGVRDAVDFVGFLTGSEKYEVIAAADALILPSEHENYSHACFEALLMGTPVVTVTGVMTWRELEASGGAIVCERNPSAMAKGLAVALSAAQNAGMGSAGQRWVRKMLEPTSLAARYLHEYEKVGSSCASRRSTATLSGLR